MEPRSSSIVTHVKLKCPIIQFFVKLLIFQIHSSTPMIFQLKSNYQNVHKSLSELKYEEMTKALFKPNKVPCCKLKLFRNFPTLLLTETANNCVRAFTQRVRLFLCGKLVIKSNQVESSVLMRHDVLFL